MEEEVKDISHSDEQADIEMLKPLISVVQQLIERMAAMDEQIECLSKLVNEEIIGGITNLYNSKKRMAGISDLQSKYAEMMGPYKDFYSEITNGSDIYEQLYDELEEFKQGKESFSDEDEMGHVSELKDILKSKFDKIKGLEPSVSIEVVKEASIPEEKKESSEDLIEKIRAMKKKAGDVRF